MRRAAGQRSCFFFFNDTPTTEIYPLPLHDALPIFSPPAAPTPPSSQVCRRTRRRASADRSEEHTSELQSQSNLVCRLLLEKKNTIIRSHRPPWTQYHNLSRLVLRCLLPRAHATYTS